MIARLSDDAGSALRDALAACEAFRDLPADTRDAVAARAEPRSWRAGDRIIRQGEPGEWFLLVASGTARADVREDAGPPRTIGRFGPGALVGEMALVTRQPRTADVTAETDVTGWVVGAAGFDGLGSRYPEIGSVLTHIVADRLGADEVDGLTGKRVDRYRIVRCVGRGSMAVVYEARDAETGDRVALKMMSHRLVFQPKALARFQREAELAEAMDHGNVARVVRRFRAYRTHFMAMEYCDGPTLADWIAARGPSPSAVARRIAGQLAAALAYLHSRGVVHRDLKPSNVIVAPGGTLRLTDFGLAKIVADGPLGRETQSGAILGTPYYMPPEAFAGAPAGPECDVYALGCVALTAVLGRCPFTETTLGDLCEAKRTFTPPAEGPLGALEPDLLDFLRTATSPVPETRTTDLAAVAAWAAPVV